MGLLCISSIRFIQENLINTLLTSIIRYNGESWFVITRLLCIAAAVTFD